MSGYVQGFVIPVPTANREAYRAMCAEVAPLFKELGALRIVEAWGVDVPRGKVTDFWRSVDAKPDETVVFAWIYWPDRATCDAAAARMAEDPRMQPPAEIPFDTTRMIFGNFEMLYGSEAP